MNMYIGCPIWSFKGWVGNFYPKGTKSSDFLREYAKRLTTIEGNTTFYAVPAQKTLETWVAELPETFRFCAKVPKAISHEGDLVDNLPQALQFVEYLRILGPRLGPMFLQLPPRFSPYQLAELTSFLEAWPSDVRLAVEVRHLDWFDSPHDETLNQLLSDHNMARVTIDTRPIRDLADDAILEDTSYKSLLEARDRKPDVPVIPRRTTDFVFIRYIGHPNVEANLPLLDEWAKYYIEQLKTGADVFAFCHSPDNLAAPILCRELYHRVGAVVSLTPLPWDDLKVETPPTPQQSTLF